MSAFRTTSAAILAALAFLAWFAHQKGAHRRNARTWAAELVDPTFHLVQKP